ncbi:hypothetical protein ScPMuIL_015512 [Solemya velum]
MTDTVNHVWKLLFRKHSSGDLHSRLKTRKLLGVGETDDGDVHRSKLSQILGHSDQLYVKLPHGLRIWQFILAVIFTVLALWAVFFPVHLFDSIFELKDGRNMTLPVRMYGAALISLSLVFWNTLHSLDRDLIRLGLMCSIVFFILQTLVTTLTLMISRNLTKSASVSLAFQALFAVVSLLFYWAIGCKLCAIRRSTSNKDLRELQRELKTQEKLAEKSHME